MVQRSKKLITLASMKRFTFLVAVIGFALAAAVSYTDSHDIDKVCTLQAFDQSYDALNSQVVVFAAELPMELIIEAPDLGSRTPNPTKVSEKLASGFKMSARAPPESKAKNQDLTY